MKEVTRLFSDLKNISGNIAKADFIRTNINNKTFMNSLKFLIRTDNPTGISTKKYDKWEDSDSMFFDENKNLPKETKLENIFSYLEVHNSGRDEDIKYIRTFGNIWCEDEEDEEFYKRIICKDYPIGVDAKSLNKIIPNFIPVWDVCLCNKYYDKPNLVDGSREFAISTKIDGCRCVAVKENGNVRLISRQGKAWLGLIDIEEDIKNINADNFVFDGELTIDDFMKYPSNDVYKMTTKIISTKDEYKKGITLNVFDMLSLDDWYNQTCTQPYSVRHENLKNTLSTTNHKHLNFVDDIYVGKNPSKIEELMKGIVRKEDWEGLVIKFTDSFYSWKRTNDWLKVKAFDEMDLIIKDVEEGTNANQGRLGALICEIEHSTLGHIEAKVGSGYSEDERIRFWSMKDELIGRVISVQYFEQTINEKTNVKSLRFPVFLELKEEGQSPNN